MLARLLLGAVAINAAGVAWFITAIQVEKGQMHPFAYWLLLAFLVAVTACETYLVLSTEAAPLP